MTVGGKNISELCDLSVVDALDFIENLELSDRDRMIAEAILKEIRSRLGFSAQRRPRIPNAFPRRRRFLAARASASALRRTSARLLMGVLYILDEPSIGPAPARLPYKLLATLKRLRDLGNTVIVVEAPTRTRYSRPTISLISAQRQASHGGDVISQRRHRGGF